MATSTLTQAPFCERPRVGHGGISPGEAVAEEEGVRGRTWGRERRAVECPQNECLTQNELDSDPWLSSKHFIFHPLLPPLSCARFCSPLPVRSFPKTQSYFPPKIPDKYMKHKCGLFFTQHMGKLRPVGKMHPAQGLPGHQSHSGCHLF